MSQITKVREGFIFLSTSQIFAVLSSFVVNIFLTRYLGKELYGQYGLILNGVLFVGLTILTNSFPQSLSKYLSEGKQDPATLFSKTLFFQLIESVIILAIVMMLSPLLGFLFDEKSLILLIILSAIVFPFHGILSQLIGLYNGLRKFKIQFLIIASLSFIRPAIIIVFTIFWNVVGAILGYVISVSIISLAFLFVSKRFLVTNIKTENTKEILAYTIRYAIFSLLLSLLSSVDILALRYSIRDVGNEFIGLYNAALTLARLPYFLIIAFSGVMFPIISNLISKGQNEKAKEQMGDMIKISTLFLIPISLVIISSSNILVKLFFGVEYLDSIVLVRILGFGYLFLGFFLVFSNILNSIKDFKATLTLTSIMIILDVILLYVLIYFLGIIGAAIATSVSIFLGLMAIVYRTNKKIGIRIKIMSLLRINLISITIFGVANYFIMQINLNIYYNILIWLLEMAIYFLCLYLVQEFNIFKWVKQFKVKVSTHFDSKK